MSEEIQKLKDNAQLTLNIHYGALVKAMNELPLNPTLKGYMFMNFDQGLYWATQAIAFMSPIPPAVEPVQAIKPIQAAEAEVILDAA